MKKLIIPKLALSLLITIAGTIYADKLLQPLKQSQGWQLQASPTMERKVAIQPPKGWLPAKEGELPSHVHAAFIGKGGFFLPPSLNVASEPFRGSLKEYLQIVKSINKSKGAIWRELGTIETKAGIGSLSQVDATTPQGALRMLHAIILKDEVIYIVTGAAQREEFPRFYEPFFSAMRSLEILAENE
jgi:hypothetical protein